MSMGPSDRIYICIADCHSVAGSNFLTLTAPCASRDLREVLVVQFICFRYDLICSLGRCIYGELNFFAIIYIANRL